MDESNELVCVHAVFVQDPTLEQQNERIGIKITCEFGRRQHVQIANSLLDDRLEALAEMLGKRILSLDLKCTAIKIAVCVKILAQLGESARVCGSIDHKFAIEYPIQKVVFVLEVIIEAFSVHKTTVADLPHTDLLERFLFKKLLQ